GYIHAADVPGRHEPGTGELNLKNVIRAIEQAGYSGFVGFELSPLNSSGIALEKIIKVLQ
ncbi:MAG: hypothetical protein GX754_11830, partial [Clostridiaceae bacterium]|nr:hypothetical protein [Clostridiaceae bacterium]